MIVKTLLDTDLYKFTTSYAYIKLFPYAMGTFSFNDRNETKYTEAFLETLKAEIKNLSQLRFTEEELEYMTKNCRFLPRVYWEWLSSFRFDPNKIVGENRVIEPTSAPLFRIWYTEKILY